MTWIVRQLTCDKGTALLVYWYGGPRYMAQYTDRASVNQYELPGYDLLREIEDKYVSGFYQRQEIQFDPRNDLNYDWTTEYNDKPLRVPIPDIMYQPSPGQPVARQDLVEGYPEEVIAKVENRA